MMNDETMKYIISRVIDNANDSKKDYEKDKNDKFNNGRALAYYEVLDTIKSELDAHGEDLSEFGLDIDLEKTFLE
ncbi:hypothetical protein SAMN04487834_104018 [Sharpea azabuensis]|uniref:Uncharacterized protein n=2 Tax=Sharpea azabuensis TaxID=322505 RepID=A0A1H6V9Z2_9FIRM|nr:hypothetical protein SAMN04487834_104018 [Sharpea azabuensis]